MIEAVDAGVDLLRAGQFADDVARLGHAQDTPRRVARDPTVLPAAVVDAGSHRDDRAAASVLDDQRRDQLRRDQRLIGEEDDDLGGLGRDGGKRRADSVPGAELLLLHREDEPVAPVEMPPQLRGIMADHDDGLRGRAPLRRLEHGVDHRATGDGMEELGEARMHPFPLTGGQDNGGALAFYSRGRWGLVGIRRGYGARRSCGFGRHRALPIRLLIHGHNDPGHAFCWRIIDAARAIIGWRARIRT